MFSWVRCLSVPAAVSVACLAGPAAPAGADEWPQRLFKLYDAPATSDFVRMSPITDVAEAPDGAVFIATGDFAGVSLLTPDGRRRRIARNGIGVAAAVEGDALVVDAQGNRLWRVSRSGAARAIAGTGQGGFSGDGGRALVAQIAPGGAELAGITETAGGSVVFTDTGNNRLRRIRPDGIIETIAGVGPSVGREFVCAPTLDREPAVAAGLCYPSDVLALSDGGFVIADTGHQRVRRIAPNGTITTIAGTGRAAFGQPPGSREGQPATKVAITFPTGLAQTRHGDIVISAHDGIGRIARDGSWHQVLGGFAADYARRVVGDGGLPTGIAATREGGLLIAAHNLYYLAPRRTSRTLVKIRGSRVDERGLTVQVEVSRRARAIVRARLDGRTVAQAARTVVGGPQRLRLDRRFADRPYDVSVTLRGPRGASARDGLPLYLGRTLRLAYASDAAQQYEDEVPVKRCRRITRRRVDCSFESEMMPPVTVRLGRTGLISVRSR